MGSLLSRFFMGSGRALRRRGLAWPQVAWPIKWALVWALAGFAPVDLWAQEGNSWGDSPSPAGDVAAGTKADKKSKSKKKEKVRFKQDELASESVLPVFDKTSVVKSRRVSTRNKVELGVGVGTDFLEPFYSKLIAEAQLTYHINELHGILLTGTGPWFTYNRLTNSAKCLQNGSCVSGVIVDVEGLPRIHTFFMGSYQYTTFYSKVSLFKYATLNMMQYFVLGGGVGAVFKDISDEHNRKAKAKKYYPAFQLGAGMKFYLNKRVALRVDLKMLLHQWVDMRHYSVRGGQSMNRKSSQWYTRSMFTAGFSGLMF